MAEIDLMAALQRSLDEAQSARLDRERERPLRPALLGVPTGPPRAPMYGGSDEGGM